MAQTPQPYRDAYRKTTNSIWRAWQLSALVCSFLALIGYWALISISSDTRRTSFLTSPGTPPQFTLLLAGRDIAYCGHHQPCKDQDSPNARRGTRTDTVMLIKVGPSKVDILTIPRDTLASQQKINAAYAYGGPELLKTRVEEITGEHIDFYAVVRTTYVEDIVNALGGLDVNVPEPGITWNDQAAGVNFHLDAGQHHLDGKNAVLYMRVRKGFGDDYGRMDHQKAALAQLVHKLREPKTLTAVVPLLLRFHSSVETNADPTLFEAIQPFLNDYQLNFATLPTIEVPGTTYLETDQAALQDLWKQSVEIVDTANASNVKIQIYDASGTDLGQKVAWALQTRGYSTVQIQQEPKSLESSQLFTLNQIAQAGHIAEFLELPRLQGLRLRVRPGEVGVFLGNDALARYAELSSLNLTKQETQANQDIR